LAVQSLELDVPGFFFGKFFKFVETRWKWKPYPRWTLAGFPAGFSHFSEFSSPTEEQELLKEISNPLKIVRKLAHATLTIFLYQVKNNSFRIAASITV